MTATIAPVLPHDIRIRREERRPAKIDVAPKRIYTPVAERRTANECSKQDARSYAKPVSSESLIRARGLKLKPTMDQGLRAGAEYLSYMESIVSASSDPGKIVRPYLKELTEYANTLFEYLGRIQRLRRYATVDEHLVYRLSPSLSLFMPSVGMERDRRITRIRITDKDTRAQAIGILATESDTEIFFLKDGLLGVTEEAQLKLLRDEGIVFTELP